MSKRDRVWTHFIINISLVIVIFVIGIFIGITVRNNDLIHQEITSRAKAHFKSIVLTRRWNAKHGGVFVEKTKDIQSNPYLDNPDIKTVDGKTYTKKNPALMTREISVLAQQEGLFFFHITSLNPLNPGNAPDSFETEALKEFEEGEKDFSRTVKENGKYMLRYMEPLLVEESCLACHAKQGYKFGDVRGGISVTFDISDVKSAIRWQNNAMIILGLLSAAILLSVIYLFIRKLNAKLSEAYKKIEDLAMEDELMRIFNRRYFFKRLPEELHRAARYKTGLGCILLDLDHFKKINDTYGHQAGDVVLQEIAATIKKICRQSDIIARYGGEEIVILLPHVNGTSPKHVAQKIRQAIEELEIKIDKDTTVTITVSLGVIGIPPDKMEEIEDYNEIIKLVDRALYEAKRKGRNRVEQVFLD